MSGVVARTTSLMRDENNLAQRLATREADYLRFLTDTSIPGGITTGPSVTSGWSNSGRRSPVACAQSPGPPLRRPAQLPVDSPQTRPRPARRPRPPHCGPPLAARKHPSPHRHRV